jgi:hypothetical protein
MKINEAQERSKINIETQESLLHMSGDRGNQQLFAFCSARRVNHVMP